MNGAFAIEQTTMCESCATVFLSTRDSDSQSTATITRLVDPTVCVCCQADNGTLDCPTIAGGPVCGSCADFLRNRPFPTWLKWSAVALVCVAVVAFAYNWRFFIAYVELLRGNRALANGNFAEGVALLDSASSRIPEIPQLAVVPNLFKARQLLLENKNEEALTLLKKAKQHAPPDALAAFQQAERQAHLSLAFLKKDYDKFLDLSHEWQKAEPRDSLVAASVASAYACKYATTGAPQFREQCLKHLQQAKAIAGPNDQEYPKYENRILHRLETREIITQEEFRQRFPDGWKSGGNP